MPTENVVIYFERFAHVKVLNEDGIRRVEYKMAENRRVSIQDMTRISNLCSLKDESGGKTNIYHSLESDTILKNYYVLLMTRIPLEGGLF